MTFRRFHARTQIRHGPRKRSQDNKITPQLYIVISAALREIVLWAGLYLLSGYALKYVVVRSNRSSIRVDGATELGTEISQSEAAAANVRPMPELKSVADWPPQRLNSVALSTRIYTFG